MYMTIWEWVLFPREFIYICGLLDMPQNEYCFQSLINNSFVSCCAKCSCAPVCALVGTCCPDVPFNPPLDELLPCQTTLQYMARRQQFDFLAPVRGDFITYRIIDACPVNSPSYRLCRYPEKLSDFIIVSSRRNGYIYGNKHCAKCHGETDIDEWPVTVEKNSCLAFENELSRSFEERDIFLVNNCQLNCIPPDPLAVLASTCLEPIYMDKMISACNETGEHYEPTIGKLCQTNSYQTAVYAFDVLYANIYCYLCNVGKATSSSGKCTMEMKTPPFGKSVPPLTVTITMVITHDDKSSCNSYEVIDPLSVSTCVHY